MQRDKLTSDPKYFETCQLHYILTSHIILTNTNPLNWLLTSLYSYITYYTNQHKPFKFTSDPKYIETCQIHYRIVYKTAHPEET